MARPIHPLTGGTHIVLKPEEAALLRRLVVAGPDYTLADTLRRALKQYAATVGVS